MSHSFASASIRFGTEVTYVSLWCAWMGFRAVKRAERAVRIVQLRKATGRLQGGAVERVPVEVWTKVLDELQQVARETARYEEEGLMEDALCEECDKKEENKVIPRWHTYSGFGPDGQGYFNCQDCTQQAWEILADLSKDDISSLLNRYGLIADWRRWPTLFASDEQCWEQYEGAEDQMPPEEGHEPLACALVLPKLSRTAVRLLTPTRHCGVEWDNSEVATSQAVSIHRFSRMLSTPGILRRYERLVKDWDLVLAADDRKDWDEEVDGPRWTPGVSMSLHLLGGQD